MIPLEQNHQIPASANIEDSLKTLQPPQEFELKQDTTTIRVESLETETRGFHTVQPKETLYAIAQIYNVGVMDLVRWNNLDLQQGIKAGQVLKLTEREEVTAEVAVATEVLHEVKVSDTLYSIARKYGVTIKEIMEWNEKKDFSLSVGEKLKVKGVR
jgi:membrane-bound lytic murein transglycosylase D